jgi:hypothetical protein
MWNPWMSYLESLPPGSAQQRILPDGRIQVPGQVPDFARPQGVPFAQQGFAPPGLADSIGGLQGKEDFYSQQSRKFSQAAAPREQQQSQALKQALKPGKGKGRR